MSYSVVVADDQDLIREHICKFVTDTDPVFKVVGSFEDGSDVIDFLKKNPVDIILTDVLMCEVSGIDVARYVYENKLRTHVVIISAYRDFEFARSAISYGVKDYLIKPTSTKELRKVLENLKEEIMAGKDARETFEDVEGLVSSLDANGEDTKTDDILEKVMSKNPSAESYRSDLLNLFQLLDSKLSELELDTSSIRKIKSEYINTAWNFTNDSLRDWVEGKLSSILSLIKGGTEDKSSRIVRRATEYINEHYMENISITDVANHVYLNEDYFGKLLKKNLNMSFSDYLMNVRMQEAIRLLKTGKYKIYQIGERVGYKSSNYFIKSFKAYTGFTPKEYCQNFGVDNEQ